MSIVITTDVFCDKCGNWVFGATGSKPYARFARYRARLAGWVRRRSQNGKMIDICPNCIREALAQETNDAKGS